MKLIHRGALGGAALLALAIPPVHDGGSAALRPADEKAIQVVRRTLDAIERGWALAAYDDAPRVRTAINLRGTNPVVGITANLVVDRRNRRLRLDAAGDVGALTLTGDRERLLLYVPSLSQFARRSGGVGGWGWVRTSLTAELAAIRSRLDAGYPLLVYRGREEIDGRPVEVVTDTPEPGTTATYWIDAESFLPRRIVLAGGGRGETRVDLAYGAGPRPVRADVVSRGDRELRMVLTPSYDGTGRVSRLQAVATPTGGGSLTTDLAFDWSPDTGPGFLAFQAPEGAVEVPFQQLATGVLLTAAGKLGAILQILSGSA
jgi:hypothetical protein